MRKIFILLNFILFFLPQSTHASSQIKEEVIEKYNKISDKILVSLDKYIKRHSVNKECHALLNLLNYSFITHDTPQPLFPKQQNQDSAELFKSYTGGLLKKKSSNSPPIKTETPLPEWTALAHMYLLISTLSLFHMPDEKGQTTLLQRVEEYFLPDLQDKTFSYFDFLIYYERLTILSTSEKDWKIPNNLDKNERKYAHFKKELIEYKFHKKSGWHTQKGCEDFLRIYNFIKSENRQEINLAKLAITHFPRIVFMPYPYYKTYKDIFSTIVRSDQNCFLIPMYFSQSNKFYDLPPCYAPSRVVSKLTRELKQQYSSHLTPVPFRDASEEETLKVMIQMRKYYSQFWNSLFEYFSQLDNIIVKDYVKRCLVLFSSQDIIKHKSLIMSPYFSNYQKLEFRKFARLMKHPYLTKLFQPFLNTYEIEDLFEIHEKFVKDVQEKMQEGNEVIRGVPFFMQDRPTIPKVGLDEYCLFFNKPNYFVFKMKNLKKKVKPIYENNQEKK